MLAAETISGGSTLQAGLSAVGPGLGCLWLAPTQTSIICIKQWIRGWTKALRRHVVWAAKAATGKYTPTGMWHGASMIQPLQQPHRRCINSLHMLP